MSTSTSTLPTAASLKDRPAGMTDVQHLEAVRSAMQLHLSAAQKLADDAAIDGRSLLASEQREFDRHDDEVRRLGLLEKRICALPHMDKPDRSQVIQTWPTFGDDRAEQNGRVLGPNQRVSDWVRTNRNGGGVPVGGGVYYTGSNPLESDRRAGDDLSLGRLLRGWVTSRWDGAQAEQRALLEGTQAGGGVLVPTPLSAQIIDRARNSSRCFQAGARIVPMDSQTLRVPRIAGSPNPAWRNENATIPEGDLIFDSILFTARSMALIVKCSRELIEDGQDVDGVVARDLAAQVAVELDRIMLRGSGVAPEPTGIRNTSGVTVTAFGGVNGAAPTSYDLLLDGMQSVRAGNFEPNGIVMAPRSANTLSKLKDTGGNYLIPPTQLATMPQFTTNQIPQNLVVGTSSDTSEVYIGDWSNLWLGMRTELVLGTLVERYADVGQVAFVVWVRADVQLAQPGSFAVLTGVRP